MIPAVSDSTAQAFNRAHKQNRGYRQGNQSDAERRDTDRRASNDRRFSGSDRRILFTSVPECEERRERYSDRRQILMDRRWGRERRGAMHHWRVFPIAEHLAKAPSRSKLGTILSIRV